MSEERFYIKDLQPIRDFCLNSEKEDIYKYIYSLQQEKQQLEEELKYTVSIVGHNKIVCEKNKENYHLKQALLDIKEYLKDKEKEFIDEPYYNNYWEYEHILDIVNKAVGSDNNE